MSAHKHATVSAWTRAEHGGYEASIDGWQLEVTWRPESPSREQPRGFLWQAKGPGDVVLKALEIQEEIEIAMADAEQAIALANKAPPAEADDEH